MVCIVHNLVSARGLLKTLAFFCFLAAGCSQTQSTEKALDAQLDALHLQKATVAPFAGQVTIDGQPPVVARGQALIVMLYDQKNPEKNKPPLYVACQKDGHFEFYTYTKGDGAPTGSYVVLFAELTGKKGVGMVQPDALHNLYDDPDKNSQNKDFVIELASPGRTDYTFNLEIAGKEAATPGPHSVTEVHKRT